MGNVLLLGGSPMIGKSTLSHMIAHQLNINYLSTDDIGEALQAVVDINPMNNQYFLDYYAENNVEKLVSDIQLYHKVIEPAIERLASIHSTWRGTVIIEGWAIYPQLSNKLINDNVKSIWLIADNSLLEKRILDNKAFDNGHVNSKKAISNYIGRSFWHNSYLKEQCKFYGFDYIKINGDETVEELTAKILEVTMFTK